MNLLFWRVADSRSLYPLPCVFMKQGNVNTFVVVLWAWWGVFLFVTG